MKEAPTHCSFIFIATAVKEQEEEEEKKYEEDGRTDGWTDERTGPREDLRILGACL